MRGWLNSLSQTMLHALALVVRKANGGLVQSIVDPEKSVISDASAKQNLVEVSQSYLAYQLVRLVFTP